MINEETQTDFGADTEISSNSPEKQDVNNNDISQDDLKESGENIFPKDSFTVTQNEEKTSENPVEGIEEKRTFSFLDESEMKAEIPVQPEIVEKESVIQLDEPVEKALPETEEIHTESHDDLTLEENIEDLKQNDISETDETVKQNIEPKQEAPITSEETLKKESEKELIRSAKQKYYDEIYSELKSKIGKKETVEVEVKARIRGGLRVHYKDIPLFLPTSHFTLKRNPTEEELQNSIGEKFHVFIHEFQEFDEGRKAVIVSRKKILVKEMWNQIKAGDIIEGRISSVATFGVFVEFNGLEGLIHISRLSRTHIDEPSKLYKKGQEIKAKIIEINKEKNKIGLSSKEFEGSAWKGVSEEFKQGDHVKGTVRRLTEFGAYIELKRGVDGLLRNNELSWTKRLKNAAEILQIGQEITVEIMTISEEKENATLSLRRINPNPWKQLSEVLKVGSEHQGRVIQVIPQGAVINIMNEVDGFMPRSKMKYFMQGKKKIPFKSGDNLIITISDINPEEQSLILAPKEVMEVPAPKPAQEKRSQSKPKQSNESTFSLVDMLSDSERQKLEGINS